MLLPPELMQELFRACDIERRLLLRAAFRGLVDYKDGKVVADISLNPLTVYNNNYPGKVFLNAPFMSDNPWNTMTRKPWVMGTAGNRWWELIWGRYRVIRSYCQYCGGDEYSTFTCNETDVVRPGYLFATARINLPASCANNWLGAVCSGGCPRIL